MITASYIAQTSTPFAFIAVAVVGALLHSRSTATRMTRLEIWQRWWAVAALACGSLWMTLTFLTIPDVMTTAIGFAKTPFVTEIAFANLCLALLGLRAVHASARERITSSLAAGMFLWGATIGHLYQWFAHGDHGPGNTGGILIYDVAIPAVMLILALRSRQRTGAPASDAPTDAAGPEVHELSASRGPLLG